LEGLAMENVGLLYGLLVYIFYGHLVCFVSIWYNYMAVWYIYPVFLCINLATLGSVSATRSGFFYDISAATEFYFLQKFIGGEKRKMKHSTKLSLMQRERVCSMK
jgi:hypothetical protein